MIYGLYKVAERLCCLLPERAVPRLGAFLGWLYGSVVRYHRADAFEALQQAFPDWPPDKVRATVRTMYRHLGTNIVEGMRLPRITPEWIKEHITFIGLDKADRVLKEGKGLLAMTAHLGNWEMVAAGVPLLGYKMGIVVKELNPEGLEKAVIDSRKRFGMLVINRRNALRPSLSALKDNRVLGFMLDQNMIRREGIYVDFFGRPACTTHGLAQLSALSGAPVMPVKVTRTAAGQHTIEIHDPIPPPAQRTPDAIRELTQRYSTILEGFIRETPEQWIWIHRRWRTKPLPGVPDALGWDGCEPRESPSSLSG